MKIGVVCGSFDLLHNGHINLIQKAFNKCDLLIVGVNSDNHIIKHKGHKPVLPEKVRLDIIRSLKYVTQAYIIENGIELVEKLNKMGVQIDYYYRGDDARYTSEQIKENETLIKYNIKPVYFKYTQNISSTKLRGVL